MGLGWEVSIEQLEVRRACSLQSVALGAQTASLKLSLTSVFKIKGFLEVLI